MTITAELHPDQPFSLAAAAGFGFGPHAGGATPGAGGMRLAFVTDDLRHHAGVYLAQRPDGSITAAVDSAADADAVLGQVRRILSLDRPVAGWLAPGDLARIAEPWRPFRTWAAVLIRAAGDRAGLAGQPAAA